MNFETGAFAPAVPERHPISLEAEQEVLGTMIVRPETMLDAAEILRADDFYDALHAKIFTTLLNHAQNGGTPKPSTLDRALSGDADYSEAGGQQYVWDVCQAVVGGPISASAEVVRELSARRELILAAQEAAQSAQTPSPDVEAAEIIERLDTDLQTVSERSDATSGEVVTAADAVLGVAERVEAIAKGERDTGLKTRFTDLDALLGGLQAGELTILAARPSMGKSAFALSLAESLADEGAIAFFSLEMDRGQIGERYVAAYTGISTTRQRTGKVSAEERAGIVDAANRLRQRPIYIDDTPQLTVARIRQRARRRQRRSGLSCVIVDYLQLLEAERRMDSKVAEVSEISRSLKALSKQLGVPVIALSQLSRKVEEREDRRPHLSDLRETGAIEQDADIVLFLYRAQYYLEREEPQRRANEKQDKFNERHERWEAQLEAAKNSAEVIVAKNRQGAIGSAHLYFDGERQRFDNLAREHSYGA